MRRRFWFEGHLRRTVVVPFKGLIVEPADHIILVIGKHLSTVLHAGLVGPREAWIPGSADRAGTDCTATRTRRAGTARRAR